MTEQTAGSQETATTQATTTETTATQTQASTTQTAQQTGQQQAQQATQQGAQQTQTQQPANANWPADWRERIAGGDEKELRRLQRFPGVPDLYKWNREMEKWKSSAKIMPELPQNATPEQMAEYRKALGVPEEPTKYYDGLKDIVVGEEDRPFVNVFFEEMHGVNANQDVVNAALRARAKIDEMQQARDVEGQQLYRQEQEEILRQAWGNADFRSNLNAIRNTMASMPERLKEGIESWVDHHGNLLMNNADFLQWIGSVSRELNPAGVVVPGGNGDQMQNIDQELAKFSEMRRANIDSWSKNEAAQKRERELLNAKEKLGARMR